MAHLKFHFPFNGVNKNFQVTTQPDYTSPDMLNVRPRDTLQGRIRGGQRPGLSVELSAADGASLGGPVVAMCMITRLDNR
jgi:hypothetical protein